MTDTFGQRVGVGIAAFAVVALLWTLALASVANAQSADRRDRRSGELALPDEYLDPAWPLPAESERIPIEESDSVENVPLDEEALDEAEREERERHEEAIASGIVPGAVIVPENESPSNVGSHDPKLDDEADPTEW